MDNIKFKTSILLFDGFETLDVFGPVEIFGRLSENFDLQYRSLKGVVVKSSQGVEIATREFLDDEPCDILFVPGGMGTRKEVFNSELLQRIKNCASLSKYILSVCTGSALLAEAGVLDGVAATSNKRAFDWVSTLGNNTQWRKKARWVKDGNIYTSSGVGAGIDMALGFVSDIWGREVADKVAFDIEYERNADPDDDKFARS